ncbi:MULTISPECIES: glutamate--tRNA ligase [Actinotignum]|uniref:Glutamate--tRNA ligase n=2 Tax=Actinotignum timonense TaxID=1870995 RepID=A0AAW9HFA2_9ACTO|nr:MULTISPECIES: glutamate--tRNA ligase [Actinotignum]MDE1557782.1 glutamate--tRNA ligase [Actinotignum schaalii]MDE1663718.1 glutamate--tRNA ligase [Actinotignum schaalii]MDK6418611.1 glutamate--tRNA ligase [Actinotignum timonense]MDK6644380.1 glutamate--tRNA ligase [Actinotignum timonense]MDK6780067.1 glutamate--tRNA ligase [Actinotignum timonense]
MAITTATGREIRVRFCPSPTGTPHVGMVRTCLFNWAYARHVGGTFIFRIEDTDAARDSEESYHQILDSLRWLGLDWDEGVEVGGPHGPYRQSQRGDIYRKVAAQLLERGYAYESFSTPEEIEARHRERGEDPKLGYDGYDRNLTEEQKAAYRAEGREPVLRMRMPDEDITFTDVIRGDITFRAGSTPDYVIVRANGDPLYTLTNPIDDALTEVTDVLRGEDLLSSTPRQIVLYRALEELGIAKWTPRFGHMPYVMGEGNKKLSKRDPESNLLLHRERGMIPEGLLNYLALLGWSFSAERDVFSKEELVEHFDIHNVNPNPARFDDKKCVAINADHIRLLDVADYTRRLVPYLSEVLSGGAYEELTDREREILDAAAPLAQTRMQLLGEARDLLGFLFVGAAELDYNEKALSKLRDSAPEALRGAREALSALDDFTPEAIKPALDAALVEGLGIKPRFAFGPLFVAMTGTNVSIPVIDSIAILGREEAVARIDQLLEKISG